MELNDFNSNQDDMASPTTQNHAVFSQNKTLVLIDVMTNLNHNVHFSYSLGCINTHLKQFHGTFCIQIFMQKRC